MTVRPRAVLPIRIQFPDGCRVELQHAVRTNT